MIASILPCTDKVSGRDVHQDLGLRLVPAKFSIFQSLTKFALQGGTGQPCHAKFSMEASWEENGTHRASFNLYVSNSGSAAVTVPYGIVLRMTGCTGLEKAWNWQVNFSTFEINLALHHRLLSCICIVFTIRKPAPSKTASTGLLLR